MRSVLFLLAGLLSPIALAGPLTLVCRSTTTEGGSQSSVTQKLEFFFDSKQVQEYRDLGRGMEEYGAPVSFSFDDEKFKITAHFVKLESFVENHKSYVRYRHFGEVTIVRETGRYYGKLDIVDKYDCFSGGDVYGCSQDIVETGSIDGMCDQVPTPAKKF